MIPNGGGIGKGTEPLRSIFGVAGDAMRPRSAILGLGTLLLLSACGEPSRPPPPYFAIPPGPPPQASVPPSGEQVGLPSRRLLSDNPYPEVQTFLPSHPEDVGRGPAAVPRPGGFTAPFYAAPPNVGPVTGYGPGGMALPPGAPPNPPYSPGGIGR